MYRRIMAALIFFSASQAQGLEVSAPDGWIKQSGQKHLAISDLLGNPEFLLSKSSTLKDDYTLSVVVHKIPAPKRARLTNSDEWRNYMVRITEGKVLVTNARMLKNGRPDKFIMEYQISTQSDEVLRIAVMAIKTDDEIHTFTFRNFKNVYDTYVPEVLKLFELLKIQN